MAAGEHPRQADDAAAPVDETALYRTLFSQVDQGLCIIEVLFDEDGHPNDYRFLDVNPAFEAQTGLTAARGRRVRELAPGLEEQWFEVYGRVALTGEPVRFQRGSGELQRFFDVFAVRVGKPEQRRVAVLFSDITERRRNEEALRESEERLQAAVEGGALGTWDLDLLTGKAARSARHDAIWGYPEPQPEWSLEIAMAGVLPEDHALIEAAYARAFETGYLSHENRIRWPDGSIHWIAANGSVRYDDEGRPVRVTGVVADITARKEAERVVLEALAAAERANLEKSRFLAMMSHELRTPLNAIIGYADLLALGVPEAIPDKAAFQVGRIAEGARHLLGIIESILTFSRVEAAREEPQLELVPLRRILDSTMELTAPLAQRKGLEFRVDTAEAPDLVFTDAQRLRQILINLVSNAIKFTERGRIEVSVRQLSGELVFTVRDTGIGIAPADIERVFQPFWQVDQSHTRTAGGTGLGLAVSRRLANLLGGDIAVESRLGEGSTFILRLPADPVQRAA